MRTLQQHWPQCPLLFSERPSLSVKEIIIQLVNMTISSPILRSKCHGVKLRVSKLPRNAQTCTVSSRLSMQLEPAQFVHT